MPRFNQKRWRPWHDSTIALKDEDKKKIVLGSVEDSRRDGCPCGCGEMPRSSNAVFGMGHDARLRGKLIRAHLTDTPILCIRFTGDARFQGEELERSEHTAMELAEVYGWEDYLEGAVKRRDTANKALLEKAMGSTRLVTVGRWEYTGQVAAVYTTPDTIGEFDIEYVTKSGETKTVRIPADEAPLAQEGTNV